MNKELIKYCIRHMSSKELAHQFFDEYDVDYRKSDTYEKLANRLDAIDELPFNMDELRIFFRDNWVACPSELHIENLKSGYLTGHSWHGAMPSMLHLSMQNKVRDCIDGEFGIAELVKIGSEIMKHEYFMVAAHDLLESEIIKKFNNTIPPIGSRSVSDFVLNGVPYDLKNTNYFGDWTKETVNEAKGEVAKLLFKDADVARLRKQAQRSLNGWGLNRFYVMVEDQERWLTEPEAILEEVCDEVANIGEPSIIKIEEIVIKTQMISI